MQDALTLQAMPSFSILVSEQLLGIVPILITIPKAPKHGVQHTYTPSCKRQTLMYLRNRLKSHAMFFQLEFDCILPLLRYPAQLRETQGSS